MTTSHPDDSDFDLRARAEFALAFDPGQPPAQLFRHTPLWLRRGVQRAVVLLLLGTCGATAVLAMRPTALVRDAIEHEYYERTLRGSFIDSQRMLEHLGLDSNQPLPGYPQLIRPCDIDGHLAYHLTSFFEKGGMVTVFAFDDPVRLPEGSGWWRNVHWKVITARNGQPLVLVAQKEKALGVAQAALQNAPLPASAGPAALAPGPFVFPPSSQSVQETP